MVTISAAAKAVGLFVLSLFMLISCPTPIDESLLDEVKDKIAPEIELFTPKEGSYCAKTVEVTGKVKDKASDSGDNGKIKKVQFEILSSSVSGDADLEDNGNFSFAFSTVTLDSNFVLKVTAEDWNGNTGEATLNLTLMDGSDIPSFSTVAGNKKVKLTWDDVPNTSSYTLYYTTEGSTPSEDYGSSVSDVTSPYTLSGLKNGAMHVFKLRGHSKDSAKDDNWSGLKQAIPLSFLTLAPKVSSGTGKLTVTWPEIPATDQFEVWRASEKGGPYVNISGVRSGTEYVDKQVSGADGFFYRIRPAMDGAGLSEPNYGVPSVFPEHPFIVDSVTTGDSAWKVALWNEYAYVADKTAGIKIYDVSDPENIVLTDTIATTMAMDVAVDGEYIYVADQLAGLRIIDMSNTENIYTIAFSGSWSANGVAVSGDYVYVAEKQGGLHIIDISDPDPNNFFVADTEPTGNSAYAVAIKDNYAFVPDYSANQLRIIDVSVIDPEDAPYVTVNTTEAAFDVTIDGNYAYVACSANLSNSAGGLKVIDLSDPPPYTVDLSIETPGRAFGVTTSGNFAYVADNTVGLQIINIKTPLSAYIHYTVYNSGANGVAVSGEYAFLAGASSGFFSIKTANPTSAVIDNTIASVGGWIGYGVEIAGDYLYIADDEGLQIRNVTDPTASSLVKKVTTPGNANQVYVGGNYAFIADNNYGLQVVDASNLTSAKIVGTVDTSGFAKDITVWGDYAFIADGATGVQIADISAPDSPSIVGTVFTVASATGVAVSGDYLYITANSAGQTYLKIVDISDITSPAVINEVTTAGNADRVVVDGVYAYVGDRGSGLQIIDISNPESASIIKTIDTAGSASLSAVSGNYVFVADANGGMQIVDISDPPNAVLVQTVGPTSYGADVAIAGRYAYLADGGGGVRVIDLLP